MILSASRRTDIPCFYSEWFCNRLQAGYVDVRNPMRPHAVSRVPLSPQVVDGIVFWTKNPAPMLKRLDALQDYAYYFQFTLTPYGADIEKRLPPKNEIVATFRKLSAAIGKERVVWRYDPIFINSTYTVQRHVACFRRLCDQLSGYTENCTVSFIDLYRKIQRSIVPYGIAPPNDSQIEELMGCFSEIACARSIALDVCAEEIDLTRFGIARAQCIEKRRLERIGQCTLNAAKDKNQRAACGCLESIDIGAYNTCKNGCVYCYANLNGTRVERQCSAYDPKAALLCSVPGPEDRVFKRNAVSLKVAQLDFWEDVKK